METIGTLWQEGQQIKRNKPKSGNYNEILDKQKIYDWSKRCIVFFKNNLYIEDSIRKFEQASANFGVSQMLRILEEYIRHQEELVSASPIIKMLGFNKACFEMCDDKPDIVLPSRTKRLIGIEITKYVHIDDARDYAEMKLGYRIKEETDIDYDLLFNIIADKEKKLEKYKIDERNNTIKKYILVINVSLAELINLDNYKSFGKIETQYDNIYIVDVNKIIQIK